MILFLVGDETIGVPPEDVRRLLAELRRVALLRVPGAAIPRSAAAAAQQLQRMIDSQSGDVPMAVLVLEAAGLLPAVEALEAEQTPTEPLEQLRRALTRLVELDAAADAELADSAGERG